MSKGAGVEQRSADSAAAAAMPPPPVPSARRPTSGTKLSKEPASDGILTASSASSSGGGVGVRSDSTDAGTVASSKKAGTRGSGSRTSPANITSDMVWTAQTALANLGGAIHMIHGLDFDDWHTMLQDGESAQDIVQICGVGL